MENQIFKKLDHISSSKFKLNKMIKKIYIKKMIFFREWKEKVDLVEDTEKDTITFYLKDSFIFRPDLSNGLTGEEIITLPHIFIAVSHFYIICK